VKLKMANPQGRISQKAGEGNLPRYPGVPLMAVVMWLRSASYRVARPKSPRYAESFSSNKMLFALMSPAEADSVR
jgi:hypothetical protein